MKKAMYKKPVVSFVETELFEDVTAECWANPHLYCLVDPYDECQDTVPAGQKYISDANYADLVGFTATNNGCNATMKDQVQAYLKANYGPAAAGAKPHYLTDEEIDTIMSSGGGNMGTSLKTSEYIVKVRSM